MGGGGGGEGGPKLYSFCCYTRFVLRHFLSCPAHLSPVLFLSVFLSLSFFLSSSSSLLCRSLTVSLVSLAAAAADDDDEVMLNVLRCQLTY